MVNWFGVRTLANLFHHLHNVHPAARTENAIHTWNLLRNLDPIALRKTARRNQHLPLVLCLGKLPQHLIRFFLRGTNKSAGVHDQHRGFIRIIHRAIPITQKQLRHRIRINCVFCTTQGD